MPLLGLTDIFVSSRTTYSVTEKIGTALPKFGQKGHHVSITNFGRSLLIQTDWVSLVGGFNYFLKVF